MSTSAGNLLSATIDASRTLPQEIREERAQEQRSDHPHLALRDFSFDPLSTCIGATCRRDHSTAERSCSAKETPNDR